MEIREGNGFPASDCTFAERQIIGENGQIASLAVATLEIEVVRSALILPGSSERLLLQSSRDQALVVPSAEDGLKYLSSKGPETTEGRISTEIARAIHNPRLFIFQEVSKRLETEIKPYSILPKVINHLRHLSTGSIPDDPAGYYTFALDREYEPIKYYDRAEKTTKECFRSKPGEVEQVAIVLADFLSEKDLESRIYETSLDLIYRLLRDYRLNTKRGIKVPEMPDLTQKLTDALDQTSFVDNPALREGVYEILSRIEIPDSFAEGLVQKMDLNRDLDHPLAFELTMAIAKSNPESAWIAEQRKRRQMLLYVLAATPQELFDFYQDLHEFSKGLVYSDDPTRPQPGKIGMEIEFEVNRKTKSVVADRNCFPDYDLLNYPEYHQSYLEGSWWNFCHDQDVAEVRRSDGWLEHGEYNYDASLTSLSKWLGDHSDALWSLHIHLDDKRHLVIPDFDGLYEYDGDELYHDEKGTWQVRFLNLPRAKNRFHPARLADVIGLLIRLSTFSESEGGTTHKNERIKVDHNLQVSLNQLLWGYITRLTEDPQARLAALMALHDERMLKNCNPLRLASAFSRDSLPKLSQVMKGVFSSDFDQQMLMILETCLQGAQELGTIWNSLNLQERELAEQFLAGLNNEISEHGDEPASNNSGLAGSFLQHPIAAAPAVFAEHFSNFEEGRLFSALSQESGF